MQQMIVSVIVQHPEYHRLLETQDSLDRDYHAAQGETNPFLHMSMHIALHEQVSTNTPPGIAALHHQLANQLGDLHDAEHLMMNCLVDALWLAQQNQRMPDENTYFDCLKKLIR